MNHQPFDLLLEAIEHRSGGVEEKERVEECGDDEEGLRSVAPVTSNDTSVPPRAYQLTPPSVDDVKKKFQCLYVPCKARGMSGDHDSNTAYLYFQGAMLMHGADLYCSNKDCFLEGVKFRWCKFCRKPVAKRNFRKRHVHSEVQQGPESNDRGAFAMIPNALIPDQEYMAQFLTQEQSCKSIGVEDTEVIGNLGTIHPNARRVSFENEEQHLVSKDAIESESKILNKAETTSVVASRRLRGSLHLTDGGKIPPVVKVSHRQASNKIRSNRIFRTSLNNENGIPKTPMKCAPQSFLARMSPIIVAKQVNKRTSENEESSNLPFKKRIIIPITNTLVEKSSNFTMEITGHNENCSNKILAAEDNSTKSLRVSRTEGDLSQYTVSEALQGKSLHQPAPKAWCDLYFSRPEIDDRNQLNTWLQKVLSVSNELRTISKPRKPLTNITNSYPPA